MLPYILKYLNNINKVNGLIAILIDILYKLILLILNKKIIALIIYLTF